MEQWETEEEELEIEKPRKVYSRKPTGFSFKKVPMDDDDDVEDEDEDWFD